MRIKKDEIGKIFGITKAGAYYKKDTKNRNPYYIVSECQAGKDCIYKDDRTVIFVLKDQKYCCNKCRVSYWANTTEGRRYLQNIAKIGGGKGGRSTAKSGWHQSTEGRKLHQLTGEITKIIRRENSKYRDVPITLTDKYPNHWRSFIRLQWRCEQRNIKTDFPPSEDGFTAFVMYIGPFPKDMEQPSIGRIDHSKGYIYNNFKWEELADNHREAAVRNKLAEKGRKARQIMIRSKTL